MAEIDDAVSDKRMRLSRDGASAVTNDFLRMPAGVCAGIALAITTVLLTIAAVAFGLRPLIGPYELLEAAAAICTTSGVSSMLIAAMLELEGRRTGLARDLCSVGCGFLLIATPIVACVLAG